MVTGGINLNLQDAVVASENPTYYDLFEVLSRHAHPVVIIDTNVAGVFPEFIHMCEARGFPLIRIPRNAQVRIGERLQSELPGECVLVAVGGLSMLRLGERIASESRHMWYVPTTFVPQIQTCLHALPTSAEQAVHRSYYVNPTFLRTISEEQLFDHAAQALSGHHAVSYVERMLHEEPDTDVVERAHRLVREAMQSRLVSHSV